MEESREIIRKLKRLEKKRSALMEVLLGNEEMALGTLRRAKRPCGNPRCGKCADGPSHEQVVLYHTTADGKRTSRFVRRSEEARFEQAAVAYRRFREAIKELKHLDSEEIELIGALKQSRSIMREG
jgi:hypothetical protein